MEREKFEGPFVVRSDPQTGETASGVYVWAPYDEGIDRQSIYVPDATEFIQPPDTSAVSHPRVLGRYSHLPEAALSGEALRAVSSVPSLGNACMQYNDKCLGGDSYPNNCAHYLSDAFIRAGYTDLLRFPGITARCRNKRPIRAHDMLRWFQSKSRQFFSGPVSQGSGVWATYQEKPGWKHVLIIDADRWEYCGTGDYSDWPTQWNYKW